MFRAVETRKSFIDCRKCLTFKYWKFKERLKKMSEMSWKKWVITGSRIFKKR